MIRTGHPPLENHFRFRESQMSWRNVSIERKSYHDCLSTWWKNHFQPPSLFFHRLQ
jgi:hypothetical protein